MQRGARRLPALLRAALLPVVLLFCGCAGYRLGPASGLPAGGKSVQVVPFSNNTLQPRLTDAVTSQLRKEVQREGSFKLASRNDADIVLSGALTKYERTEVTFAPQDILTVRDYRLVLTAQVTARDRATGNVLLEQRVAGYTLMRVGADLSSAERQAMPLLAADLARNTIALLAEGSW